MSSSAASAGLCRALWPAEYLFLVGAHFSCTSRMRAVRVVPLHSDGHLAMAPCGKAPYAQIANAHDFIMGLSEKYDSAWFGRCGGNVAEGDNIASPAGACDGLSHRTHGCQQSHQFVSSGTVASTPNSLQRIARAAGPSRACTLWGP
jgi:hypothetical protein